MARKRAKVLRFTPAVRRGRPWGPKPLGGWPLAAACLAAFAVTLAGGLALERWAVRGLWPSQPAESALPAVAPARLDGPRPPQAPRPAPARPAGAASPEPAAEVATVIDGDTFVLAGGERVRVLNIDTPEMPPKARCAAEAQLAQAAKARLEDLIGGRAVELRAEGRDRDGYGRLLRRVEVQGQDVGAALVAEGLARPWRGRREPWC